MTSSNEKKIMARWRNIIHGNGRITFVDLIDTSHVSITEYNKLKAYFTLKYESELKYVKDTKEWVSFAKPEIETLETSKDILKNE